MRAMRAVSFLGPEEGKLGAEVTDAAAGDGTGIETGGGLGGETGEVGGGWKNSGESRSWSAGFETGGGPVGARRGAVSDG